MTLIFPAATGLAVTVLDGKDKTTAITDYRWIIEEDRTFYIDPNCTTNPPPAGCPTFGSGIVPTFGTNFHTSYMPVVATGCTGAVPANRARRVRGAAGGVRRRQRCLQDHAVRNRRRSIPARSTWIRPSATTSRSCPAMRQPVRERGQLSEQSNAKLRPRHGWRSDRLRARDGIGDVYRYYGVFPTSVTVLAQPTPFPPAKLSVFVFEDDFPLNGEQDGGGGIDVLSPKSPVWAASTSRCSTMPAAPATRPDR